MRLTLRIIMDARTAKAAERVVARVRERVPAPFEPPQPYFKGGFAARAAIHAAPTPWPEAVFEALRLAARLGHGLQLSGDLESDLSICLDRVSVSGLVFVELRLERTPVGG